MSKGLEALKEIKDIRAKTYYVLELKLDDKLTEDLIIIEKELKALEIIKPLVNLTKDTSGCWLWLGLNGIQISEEEYDLLKEVSL